VAAGRRAATICEPGRPAAGSSHRRMVGVLALRSSVSTTVSGVGGNCGIGNDADAGNGDCFHLYGRRSGSKRYPQAPRWRAAGEPNAFDLQSMISPENVHGPPEMEGSFAICGAGVTKAAIRAPLVLGIGKSICGGCCRMEAPAWRPYAGSFTTLTASPFASAAHGAVHAVPRIGGVPRRWAVGHIAGGRQKILDHE